MEFKFLDIRKLTVEVCEYFMDRGDVFLANLGDTERFLIGGTRPVLIITKNSPETESAPTVLVAPITAKTKKKLLSTHIRINAGQGGLETDALILMEQVRVIDKDKLIKQVGTLNEDIYYKIVESQRTAYLFCTDPQYYDFMVDILDEFGVQTQRFDHLNEISTYLKVRDTNSFYVAVITKKDPEIFYHIGYAQGKGIPVFLVLSKDVNIPTDVKGTVSIRTEMDNITAVNFALTPFLRNLKIKQKKVNNLKKDVIEVNSLLEKIEDIRTNGNGRMVEDIIGEVFEGLELGVVVRNRIQEGRDIDFAIWVDEIENSLGNPIIVEVKYGHLSESLLIQAEQQVLKSLIQTNTQSGIVLYLDVLDRRFKNNYLNATNIFRFEISDLLRMLERQSFAQILLETRNNVLHGKGDQ